MINLKGDRYYVSTKVRGVAGSKVPGRYFGYQGTKAVAKIHAQPLIKDIAADPAIVDSAWVSNMIVRFTVNGEEHPIGMIDQKYACICEGHVFHVKSYEIRGYEKSLEPGKEYLRLGVNITFEITKEQVNEFLRKNREEALYSENLINPITISEKP